MNDNSIFNDSVEPEEQPKQVPDPMDIDPSPVFTNLKIIFAYFVFMIIASVASAFVISNQSTQTRDWIEGALDYEIVTEQGDLSINIFGSISNVIDEDIDVIYFYFDLEDEEGNVFETIEHRIRYLEPGETAQVDATKPISMAPDNVTIKFQIPVDATLSNVLQMVVTLLAFIALWFLNKRDYIRDYKKFKKSPKEFFGLVVTGMILVYAANIMANVIMDLLNATETSLNESAIQSMFSSNALNLIALFFTLVILTPIVEETVFRKGLYGLVDRKFGDIAAILVSGFVFGFLHVAGWGDYINIIPYLFMGLSFSFIYYYSNKNVYVVIIIHMINNLIPFSIYLIDAIG